ncbi:MAG: hypothetical protein WD317_09515 [Balneolaceae bacterium]
MNRTTKSDTGSVSLSDVFKAGIWVILPLVISGSGNLAAQPAQPYPSNDVQPAERNNTGITGPERGFENKNEEVISVGELMTWNRRGDGYFGNFMDQALQLTEDPHSSGIMLISPESYGTEFVLTYDVMTLQPATVLVNMLSASNGDGSGRLDVPPGFNGDLSEWTEGATDYFFAFHNAPHMRYPFLLQRSPEGVSQLGEADRNYMETGQWHQVEAGRNGNRLWLTIDGTTVLNTTDSDPIDGGHIAFRIRGTGAEHASCLIRNVTIQTPDR